MSFKQSIKQARLKSGISQENAGKAIHRSRGAIKGYEEGVSSPDPDQLVILCKLFKTTPNDLLGFQCQQQNEEAKMKKHKYKAWDDYQERMLSWGELGGADEKGTLSLWNTLNGFVEHIKPLEFIGRIDKAGKEIYEGDIVEFISKHKNKYFGEIIWIPFNNIAGFQTSSPYINIFDSESIEVIGNIYENSELMEE